MFKVASDALITCQQVTFCHESARLNCSGISHSELPVHDVPRCPVLQAAAKPTALSPPVFGPRIIIGLLGVLLAVLVSGLNEMVTKVALADIRGALYIGFDEATWLVAAYTATSVAAMAFAPWCSVTFSLRRFTLCAIGLFTVLGILCPFAPNYESLLLLRTVQGLAGGALPPMLMTVALRFCRPTSSCTGWPVTR